MSEGPLSITLNTREAKTGFPVIVDGTMAKYRLQNITAVETEKGPVLKWEYELVDPVPVVGQDDAPLMPGDFGSKFFENIQLYAKPDAKDPEWFLKKVSTRMDALLGTADIGNTKDKPERPGFDDDAVSMMIGKTLVAKVKVKVYEGNTSNEWANVFFPEDLEAA